MARTVREARIETRTARAKLKPGRQPHWRALLPGRLRLGYQRKPDATAGRWLLMRRRGGAYHVEPLGWADDADGADGLSVLTFEQAQAKALENADAGEDQPRYRLTVRRALADYVEFKQSEGRDTNDTERRAAAHILPVLGDIEVADLTSTRIRRWLSDLAASPAFKRTKKGADRKFKPTPEDEEAVRRRRSSANRVLSTLKAALNHAYDEKRVASNDAWGRRVKPFRDVDVARVRYLTVAEAQRLINACAPVFRPLVIAALQTGARYGELARLTVADLQRDFRHGPRAQEQERQAEAHRIDRRGRHVLPADLRRPRRRRVDVPSRNRRTLDALTARALHVGGGNAREDFSSDFIPRSAAHMGKPERDEWSAFDDRRQEPRSRRHRDG